MSIRHFFVVFAAGLCVGATNGALAGPLRLGCDDYSNSGASMWARYIDSGERRTLDVVLKTPDNGALRGEPNRSVLIGDRNIGMIKLKPNAAGMMSGSLSYDSYAAYGDANPGVASFPGGWTGAISGNLVRVAGLSCTLAD